MVVRPQPNLCANTSRRRAKLPANPPGRGLATALRFVIGRRNRYRGLHEQANPDNSKTTPHIFGYGFLGVEFQTQGVRGPVGRRPDFAKPPSRPISRLVATSTRPRQSEAAAGLGAPRFSPYRSRLFQARYDFVIRRRGEPATPGGGCG
jgi:hypothetical protein